MILSINTGSEQNSIALLGKDIAEEIFWKSYRTQSKELLPKIDRLLKLNKIKLTNLEAIAAFQGPGSYTGLRVGISVANALGWGLDIPVMGIKNGQGEYNNLSALEIAKKAEKIIKVKKLYKFSKIVIPYYGSQLK